MNRPYRKYGRPQLEKVFRENRNSRHVLNELKHELESRDTTASYRPDIWKLYEDVLSALKEMDLATKTQSEDEKLRLRLQAIEQLRNQAENTGVFEWFKWPTTDALMGDGTLDTSGWYELGLLKYVGYHAGNNGEHPEVRRHILDCVFRYELPHVNSDEYMSEFGTPKSSQRLRKIANVLASSAIKLKGKTHADCSQAIADYESDLEYLYDEYYVGVFHFDRHPANAGHFDWPQI